MATLPDLDTSDLGFIAWWNAIDDGGVNSIEVSEILTNGRIEEYTLYDNGVIGTFDPWNGRETTFRVKDDGWFVAYFDDTEEYFEWSGGSGNPSHAESPRGHRDIAHNWLVATDNSDFLHHTLGRVIFSLAGHLENSGDLTTESEDVGTYNYVFPDAEFYTGFSSSWNRHWGSSGTRSDSFLYTEGTDIIHAEAFTSINDSGSEDGRATFENETYLEAGWANAGAGALDLDPSGPENMIPNHSTEYTHYTYNNARSSNGDRSWGNPHILLFWK